MSEAEQPALFDDLPEIEQMYAAGNYSGERYKMMFPDKYQAILRAHAEGVGTLAICRAFRPLSPNTLYAILRNEGASIERYKEEVIAGLRSAAAIGADRLAGMLVDTKIDAQKLAITLGITIDKLQLLLGEPTSIHGEAKPAPSHADINAWLETVKRADAETVSEGENLLQIGDDPSGRDGAVDAIPDIQSGMAASNSEASSEGATQPATHEGQDPDDADGLDLDDGRSGRGAGGV